MKEVIAPSYKIFTWNRMKPLGLCDWENREIFINEKAHKNKPVEMLDTLVHEEAHAVYPEFNEREVAGLVAEMLPTLTHPQIVAYFNLYYGN